MTALPTPAPILHFTHVEHLATILQHGLLSDSEAHSRGVLTVEVGNLGIKDHRRDRPVPSASGGHVADYVPFYFGPRSPMMFAIANGNVPTYTGGTSRLIYLVSTVQRLHELGHSPVLTDRNAALRYAEFREFDPANPPDEDFIDWDLIKAKYWGDFADGRERRMAECLVRDAVGLDAVIQIGAQNNVVADEVRRVLNGRSIPVNVRPSWYF